MSPWPGNRTKRPSVSAESPKELSGCLSGPLPSGHHSVLPLRHHVQVLHTLGQHGKESSPDQGNRFFRDGIIVSMYKQIAAVQRLQPAINIVDESCIESLPDGFTGTVDAVTVLGQFILQRLPAKLKGRFISLRQSGHFQLIVFRQRAGAAQPEKSLIQILKPLFPAQVIAHLFTLLRT